MPIHGAYWDPYEEVTEVSAPSPERAIVKALSSLDRGEKFAYVETELIHDDEYEVRITVG
jgi:hypothetical protein